MKQAKSIFFKLINKVAFFWPLLTLSKRALPYTQELFGGYETPSREISHHDKLAMLERLDQPKRRRPALLLVKMPWMATRTNHDQDVKLLAHQTRTSHSV